MTEQELQSVINAVLSSIKTNSRSIGQLTGVQTLSDNDCFEVAGGRKIAYSVLRDLIFAAAKTKLENIQTDMEKLQTAVNTLVAGNVSDAIDNFNEVIAFLEGIKDNEKLTSKLVELQKEIDKKQDPATTLAGYGITDAYTKQEADTLLNGKAEKAATLAGYGITDAYTKAEVDALIRSIEGAIAEDANESDIDEIINQL